MMKTKKNIKPETNSKLSSVVFEINKAIQIPSYLNQNYWWAYIHPMGVKFFDRLWMVSAILFGNFNKLRDMVVEELDHTDGDTLQVAAVYGDFSSKIAEKLAIGINWMLLRLLQYNYKISVKKLVCYITIFV